MLCTDGTDSVRNGDIDIKYWNKEREASRDNILNNKRYLFWNVNYHNAHFYTKNKSAPLGVEDL